VGNGKNTPFWKSKWLQGAAPKDLAPGLFRGTIFKFRSMFQELKNNSWIWSLDQINTQGLMEEFVTSYLALTSVELTDQNDNISWIWTPYGNFSVASAYQCQFMGAVIPFPAKHIWKATIEPKCKFFVWLVLHNRALTADNMAKKNWDCDPICPLCCCMQETTSHILIHCNYVEPLWNAIAGRFNLPMFSDMIMFSHPVQWVSFLQRKKLGILFCFWWQIWKERNRRIFEGKECSVNRVDAIIQEELSVNNLAQTFSASTDST
jgi:hypothetical protein